MIKLYLKQAWALLRQNPLFSGLYIAGTGLAIAMTMIVAMIYYVKLAPVYPEVNRGRTLYLTSTSFTDGRSTYQSALSYSALQDWALHFENAEVISAQFSSWQFTENAYIQPEDRSGDFHPSWRGIPSRRATCRAASARRSSRTTWRGGCSAPRRAWWVNHSLLVMSTIGCVAWSRAAATSRRSPTHKSICLIQWIPATVTDKLICFPTWVLST